MNIRQIADVLGSLDASNQSSEAAIADFIIEQLKLNPQRPNKKAFLVTVIQAYALLLQDSGVKVVA